MNRNDIDCYKLLGIDITAGEQEIKDAYKKAVKISHPDLASNGDKISAEETTKLLNQAKDILLNPQKRKQYDLEYFSKNTSVHFRSSHSYTEAYAATNSYDNIYISYNDLENLFGSIFSVNFDDFYNFTGDDFEDFNIMENKIREKTRSQNNVYLYSTKFDFYKHREGIKFVENMMSSFGVDIMDSEIKEGTKYVHFYIWVRDSNKKLQQALSRLKEQGYVMVRKKSNSL